MPRGRGKRRRRRQARVVGAAPGTLTAQPGAAASRLQLFAYDEQRVEISMLQDPAEIEPLRASWPRLWLDVVGLGDVATIAEVGAVFGLHQLALEDVLNPAQRPKAEDYGDTMLIVVRLPVRGEDGLQSEQLTIACGEGFVVTFQERSLPCLDAVRQRLRQGTGRVRGAGADYLAYALLDAVVDAFFPLLDAYGEELEALEYQLGARPTPEVATAIHGVRHDLLLLRRAVWPLREAIALLQRADGPRFGEAIAPYLRDCFDHASRLMDLLESYRELSRSLGEAYATNVSLRAAEITRVLTIVATIFIPLTFVAGVYGMNFNSARSPYNMPELSWAWGYPACLALMATIAAAMVLFFRHKRWLGSAPRPPKRPSQPDPQ